ncbi:methyltransferase domain-containing protein [Paenibacillus rhizovicinus]|uniref:Methyltransferase domain-containing protein n=1 Tax=Paenibacillus rhizovicinus TaxID=2704463 RepID=A0A6C0NXI7_9BACL|nr:class I SAM-dependent methyltransferase [Paenibacillus rhizovicinus]QHW30919.1 methyltransferase domain-containing protein [Paenibacillus rhizovicinus]
MSMNTVDTYEGILAETYDMRFGGNQHDEVEFYKHMINEVPGKALELGCGTGRLLLPYLAAGIDVEGADCSSDMLDLCRAKAQAGGQTPVLYEQYMEQLQLPKKYRTIYIPAASFVLLSEREIAMEALRRIHAHLEDEGQALVPLFIPKHLFSNHEDKWTSGFKGTGSDGADIVVSSKTSIDFLEQLHTKLERYEIFRDGVLLDTRYSTTRMRWYGKYEFLMMLEQAGFHDVSVYGDYAFQEVNPDQSFMIVRARK